MPGTGAALTRANIAITQANIAAALRTDLATSGGSALVNFLQAGTGAVARPMQNKARDVVSFYDLGAVGDGVQRATGAITSTSTTLTDSGNPFKASDVGKAIGIAGAGPAGATLVTVIAAYVSAGQVTLAVAASTTVSGASYAYGTDNTAAKQTMMNRLADNTFGAVYIPDGVYVCSGTATVNQGQFVGKHVYGQSRSNTVFVMLADNTAHFDITFNLMHSNDWEILTLTWVSPQIGNTNSCGFRFRPLSSYGNIYNSTFSKIFISNGYWFIRQDSGSLFWGNSVRDIYAVTVGGFVNLASNAGQPKCVFDNIYVYGGAPGETLFKMSAMVAEYFVEVNTSSAAMLSDTAGGTHLVRHWAIETCAYTTNTTLFLMTNSKLIFQHGYWSNGSNVAAGMIVTVFSASGGTSDISGGTFVMNVGTVGAGGAVYFFNCANLAQAARFDVINANWSTSPSVGLSWFSGSATATQIKVLSWNDTTRTDLPGDADITLTEQSGGITMFGTPLTANRKVILPSASSTQLFNGWKRRIIKTATAGTSYAITVYQSDGTTVIANIPAAVTGEVNIRWDRSPPAGGLGGFTVESRATPLVDTGYTAMTGAADKATALATSTVTLAQLAGRVMALQAALTATGVISL